MKKLLLGVVGLFNACSLPAANSMVTENVAVPFDFKVKQVIMPAGEYRVEQDFGQLFVSVVNVRTGARVHVMRDDAARKPGRAKLIFEPTGNGYKLAKVS